MVEQVEEVGSELQVFRLGQRKPLPYGKIDVALSWPTQHVASDIADIRSRVTCQGGRIMCTRNRLTWLHRSLRKSRRIEVITWRDVIRGASAVRYAINYDD